MLTKEGNKK